MERHIETDPCLPQIGMKIIFRENLENFKGCLESKNR